VTYRNAAHEDLTARARIRDAALTMFAERGTDGATIRDIALAAGVSAGLVRHHFGSKEALREACDTHAIDRLLAIKEGAVDGDFSDLSFLAGPQPEFLQLYRYFARALLDGSAAAAAMFDRMVEETEKWLDRHRPGITGDPRGYAAMLVAQQLGVLGMHEHLSRTLGTDTLGADGQLRMGRVAVDLHSTTLLTADQATQAHRALDQVQQQRDRVREQRERQNR
jgi:AcrR family transcriptional regulator